MPKNEEGEFELVLGNRQLLSIFFIVIILFGVFFTMGYIVGRNSAPTVASAPPSKTGAGESAASNPAGAGAVAETPPQDSGQPSALQPSAEAQPSQTQAAAPQAAAPAEKPPSEEAAAPAAKPPETPEPPASRIYLQVAAVGRPDAEVEVNTLKKRGFPAMMAPAPREGIFRVLVGPYKDAASVGKAKAELENLGFKPIVRR